jgi:hypothetical protein
MGTEAFWVPAVIAAVGTAAQGANQMAANKREQNSEVQAMDDQQQFRENANSQVKNLTQQIAQNSPDKIAQQETGDFVNTLRKNAAGSAAPGATGSNPSTNFGGPVSALAPASGASSRYNTDTANSQKEVQDYGNTNAQEISAVDSAVRQRQNEGLALNTLGTNLNTLGAESYTKNFVDQLRSKTAGQANPWVSLFSGMLQNGASAYAKNPTMFSTPNSVGGGQYIDPTMDYFGVGTSP